MARRPDAPGPSLPFLLAQVGAHGAMRWAEKLTTLGLDPQHTGILRVLIGAAGISQQELATRLSIVPSRLVALIDELEGRGFVERRANPNDRRSHALHLTAAGLKLTEAIGKLGKEHQESLCGGLTAAERDQLRALLTKIVEEQQLTPGVHPGYGLLGPKGLP